MRVSVPRLLLYALVFAVGGALLVGGATSTAVFGAFNTDWDGTSELRDTAEMSGSDPVIVRNTTRYDDYGSEDIAFVLAPTESYSERDAESVQSFVERGGTLVVADQEGTHSHPLLAAVGANARVNGSTLRDEQNYYRGAALPVADTIEGEDHRLVQNVSSVTLNHGTAVEPNGATVLISSSRFAYLDLDDSGGLSGTDTIGSYPVVTVESIGDGEVVLVSDPSLFINVMQIQENNRAFTAALVNGTDHTVVDVSHAASPPPLVIALLTIRNSAVLSLGIGLGATVIIGGGLRVFTARFRQKSATERIESDVETLLDGFDDEKLDNRERSRLRRVTEGIIRNQSESDDNE